MTASGHVTHLCDPCDVELDDPLDTRRALCGAGPVYFSPRPLEPDPLEVAGLCVRCRSAARSWVPEEMPVPAGPDPLLHLLRAGGLDEERAAAAAGIARGYLASEYGNALARAGLAAAGALRRTQAHADSLGRGHPAPVVWRGISAGLSWARDVVHARRIWPPQPEPPAPPDGIADA